MVITSVIMIIIEVADNAKGEYVVDETTDQGQHNNTTYSTKLGLCPHILRLPSYPKLYISDCIQRL